MEHELSVQMRLYTMSKRHFVLVFATFFACFGLTLLIGVAGPSVINATVEQATHLSMKPPDLKVGPFQLTSPTLSTFNQQLWLMCEIELAERSNGAFEQNFNLSVAITGRERDASMVMVNTVSYNRSRCLRCSQQKCDEIIVLHLGFLDYTKYLVRVQFQGLEQIVHLIQEVNFTFKVYNAAFTQVEIWFRFVFLLLTFLVTCLFAHSLRKFSMRDWAIEQKWMAILLPLLLLYNDPIFPLSFLVNSWVPGLLDAIFQASFLSALLLFWLCVYHGIRTQSNRRFFTFYLPKLLIVGLLWVAAVTLGIWQTMNELQDPTFQYRVDTGNFEGMKIFFFVVGAMYILYLVFLIVRACTELRNMPYFDLRLKFLTVLTLMVLVISITILFLRFGSQVLQDNFISQLSTHYQNSAEFLSFYGLLNFYLYTLAFVYSPSKNAVYESQLKDNPTFSMLNDSDDDVIYGTDHEELPLQNGRSMRTSYHDGSDSD
ncbi:transmembrane protein 181 isoform X1 [Petromyzon marinus]|uniref:Transmembrane protein 181 isoform X1 n=2 Tax=Petromyzon marinus TaxID=7757 RepID=A0AAJ7U3N1_PETMA|nr:transmembrane protein 181 isoform X1 [Petromyzon marinus]XP_032829255.1 transmembrane protein 181 isoform X1 [Petromyzon marinus]XP_032829256.1 transmembrane protein 181 isoform X1 [Petromyzon marinus]